jgi:predicted nucleotidyltransferase
MVDPSVERSARIYLRCLRDHGFPVRFGIIFGSQATARADNWSDIDFLVVSPRFDGPRDRKDIDLLWRLAAQTDSRIEPIPCGAIQWRDDTSSALVEIARREGQAIGLEEG